MFSSLLSEVVKVGNVESPGEAARHGHEEADRVQRGESQSLECQKGAGLVPCRGRAVALRIELGHGGQVLACHGAF